MTDKKLSLQEEELLSEEVRAFSCLYDKTRKAYKERDVVRNAWNSVADKLDFLETDKTSFIKYSQTMSFKMHVTYYFE